MQKKFQITAMFTLLFAMSTVSGSAASQGACKAYANRAVQQYKLMMAHNKCRVKTDPRWQPSYDNHYQWCRSAPDAWLASEQKARDTHLTACGAQPGAPQSFDPGTELNPVK